MHSVGSRAGRHGLGAAGPTYPGLAQRQQNDGIKTLTRVEFGRVSGFPGPSGQLPRIGTRFAPDQYEHRQPRKIDPGCQVRLPAGHGAPDAALMDTVARLQLDME